MITNWNRDLAAAALEHGLYYGVDGDEDLRSRTVFDGDGVQVLEVDPKYDRIPLWDLVHLIAFVLNDYCKLVQERASTNADVGE